MTPARYFLSTTAIGFSFLATTACAELTAQDVWGDWRAYIEGMGYSVSATQTENGDTLTLEGITISGNETENAGAMTLRMGGMQFVENGDGTVDVVLPDSMPLNVDIAAQGINPATQIEVVYTQSGQKMTASGDPAAYSYDYSADGFGMTLSTLVVDGGVKSRDNARFTLKGGPLTSQTQVSAADARSYVQTLQIASLTYDLFFKDPEGAEAVAMNSTLGPISFSGSSSVPAGGLALTGEVAPMIASGFAFDGTFNTQGTETLIEITSDEGTSKLKTGSANSSLGVAMGPDGIRYAVSADEVQMGGQLAGLPFPLFVEMAKYAFDMRFPVSKSDDPQDFKLAFNMTDFTTSDIIWALFDASGQLPRDPATLALDLGGKARVLVDGLSAESAQQLAASGTRPAEVTALKIDRLLLDAVGAKLEATGDLTFDNTKAAAMAGLPQPVGDINIDIAGANGLLDKLTAMGVLPNDQAMGARMMMGLFAVPGAAPDTLTSKIEFNDGGQILANGQRIK